MAVDPVLHLNQSTVVTEPPFLALVDELRESYVRCTAETAECTCPEFCERDHDRD